MCYSIMVENDLAWLGREFDATLDQDAMATYAALRAKAPKKFKDVAEHPRIYPNYWAPIIVHDQGKLWIRPMRYRVLPAWSPIEIPSQYNLFNARLDRLQERRSWRALLGKRHGLLVFSAFYEWVEDSAGKKHVLKFFPSDRRRILAPVLWDLWEKANFPPHEVPARPFDRLASFAVITGDPNPEVLAAGHDRSPIFLRRAAVLPWLRPEGQSQADLLQLLSQLEAVHYAHELAAA